MVKVTKHPCVHAFKGLTLFSVLIGYVNPNIHEILPLKQSLRPSLLRVLNFFKIPSTALLTIVMIDYLVTIAKLMISGKHSMIIHNIAGLLAAFACWHRFLVLYNKNDILTSCINYIDKFLSRNVKNEWNWRVIKKDSNTVRNMALLYLFTSLNLTVPANAIFVHNNHRSPRASNIPGPEYIRIIVTFLFSIGFVFWQTAYYWKLMMFMAIPASELKILRADLERIFSSFYVDLEGEKRVNKMLVNRYEISYKPEDQEDVLEQVNVKSIFQVVRLQKDDMLPENSGVIAANPVFNTEMYKTHVYYVDQALNAWIRRHRKVFGHCKIVNKVFAGTIMTTYFFATLLTTSLIYLNASSLTTKKHPMSTILHAILNLQILYCECHVGDMLTEASEDVCKDVFGRDWFIYPVSVQKKLLFIMQISQQRPISVSMFGLNPLNHNTFYAVINAAYSMFSFLSGSINVD